MRIKTFTADTMADAMAQVREELGDDAVIVASHQGAKGRGVEVRAAITHTVTPKTPTQAEPAKDLDDEDIQLASEIFEQNLRERLRAISPQLSGHPQVAQTNGGGRRGPRCAKDAKRFGQTHSQISSVFRSAGPRSFVCL